MKKILNVGSSLLLVTLLLMAFLIVVGRSQGRSAFIVLSGSMEPAYPVGGLLLTKPVAFKQLELGDAITFYSRGSTEKVVTHRIVELDQQTGSVKTKGDANQSVDGQPLQAQDVIGKVTMILPYVGYGLAFIQSNVGKWLFLIGLISLLSRYVIRYFFSSASRINVPTSDGRR